MRESDLIHSKDRIKDALHQLGRIRKLMRQFGLMIVTLTVVNLAATSALATDMLSLRSILFAYSISAAIGSIILAFLFDRWRSDGDAYFEEISEALHGRNSLDTKFLDSIEELSFDARIELRLYSKSAELPLIPGQFGPAIFVFVNIFLSAMTVLLIRSAYL